MKYLALALLLTGCLTEPEKRTRVIDCGTLDLTDNNGEMRDTLEVKNGKCGQ